MSFLDLLLLLLILLSSCLSLHVCDARHLQLTQKENPKQVYHFTKDVEETKVSETSITSSLRASPLEGYISQRKKVIIGERNDHHSRGGANKQKDDSNSKLLFKQQEQANGAPSGNENMVSFIQKEVQAAMNIKGVVLMKRNVRSLLGSAQHNAEETVDDDVKENNDAEDNIVVMDYAQPHRKPPIHNEKH